MEAHFNARPIPTSFVRRRDWENAYPLLAQILPPDNSAKIELLYEAYTQIEEILCRSNIDSIDELHYRYRITVELTQLTFEYLKEEVNKKDLTLPPPIDFI